MNYKPSDFFIGVIDFFAVLLPGALLTFFMQAHWYGVFFGEGKIFPMLQTDIEKGLVFIVVTYILGNIVFLISSAILDPFVYDRFLRDLFFKKNGDLLFHTARAIKEKYLQSSLVINNLLMQNKLEEADKKELESKREKEVLNTYKWAQHFMLMKQPEALIDVKKPEADSKFFRCLVIAFIFIAIVSFADKTVNNHILIGFIFLLFSLLSVYRYGNLRYKSTQRAYEFIVTYYYLNNPVEENSAVTNTHKLKESIINKTAPVPDLSDQLPAKHQELVTQLKKGIHKNNKQLTIPGGKDKRIFFTSEKEETWYCLNGKGVLQYENADMHLLIPNATITIPKNKTYSFINKLQEPLELVVFNN
jgi:mannose-6-phosphate isomerase-like protein (cupin superfamily)